MGKKLDNPYTVENMKKAYIELKREYAEKSGSGEEIDIRTTHLYIRFLPANLDEYNVLAEDSTLELFEYPLDYDIEQGGTEYHDPELAENQITWQYCAVPVNFKFPQIEHELIEELYLPQEDEEVEFEKSGEEMTFIDFLEMKAMLITGNISNEEYMTVYQKKRKKWNPSGRIQVNDEVLGRVAVAGVKIRIRKWYTMKSVFTDNQGRFKSSKKFKGGVKYEIKFERADFTIRHNNYRQAYLVRGGSHTSAWNTTVREQTLSSLYCNIHRAAHTYYYGHQRWGIKSPPKQGGILRRRVNIGAHNKRGRAHYFSFKSFIFASSIDIYRMDNNGTRNDSEDIFGTTIHELAHASHWEIGYGNGQFAVDAIFSRPILCESWAKGVETVITTDVYGAEHDTWQWRRVGDVRFGEGYTCIVWDMIDNNG